MTLRTGALICGVLLGHIHCAPAQVDSQPSTRSAGPVLVLSTSTLLDLHMAARAALDPGDAALTARAPTAAVAAVRAAEERLGGALAWGLIEGIFTRAQNVAEARSLCARLPEDHTDRAGLHRPLRQIALDLLAAFAICEPDFVADVWPEHAQQIAAARNLLERELLPRQSECFAAIGDALGFPPRALEIPVVLVAVAPFPGGFTHRRPGGAVCIVGVRDASGSSLCEVVVHEAIHALDVANLEQPTALVELRAALKRAGIDERAAAFRDVPHTLIFVQAAESVRRVLDPTHRDYGEVSGYYAKVPAASAAVRPAWQAYLDGRLTRAAGIDRIVAAARPAP